MNSVVIDTALCKRCGICVEFCPAKVFIQEIDGTPVPQYQGKCTGCKLCVLRCPDFAIEVEVGEDDNK